MRVFFHVAQHQRQVKRLQHRGQGAVDHGTGLVAGGGKLAEEPLFCAKDVCAILGLNKYRDAIALLDEDERASSKTDTLGGMQKMAFVTESGLYALIFQSRKAEAKKFRQWVTQEVLPAIRRKGAYSLGDMPRSYPEAMQRTRFSRFDQLSCSTVSFFAVLRGMLNKTISDSFLSFVVNAICFAVTSME